MKLGFVCSLAASLLGGTAAWAQTSAPNANTAVIAFSTDAATLDPPSINSRDTQNIADHIWGSLYEVGDDGSLIPYLADSYTVSDDGTEMLFKIHPGLTCHDGSPLKAEDVAYTFKRAADPKNAFVGSTPGFVFTSLGYKDARVVDPQTVAIKMAGYNPIALGLISEVKILCKASYENRPLTETSQKPIGSGPYRFVEWVKSDHITLERVPNFPLRPNPIEKIVFRVIPEASTRAAELLAGNVDVVTSVAPDQIDVINKSSKAKVQAVAGTRRMYVGFQLKPGVFTDKGGLAIQKAEVRRALQYAIDVPTICDKLLNAPCVRATGLVNAPNDNKDLKPYPYDPAMAEKLLDQAGYPRDKDGVRFELNFQSSPGRYLNDRNVILAITQYLNDIGVKTTDQFMDWTSAYLPLTRAKKEAGPLFFLGTGGGTWSALYDMSDLSDPGAVTNATNWADPAFFSGWADLNKRQSPADQKKVVDRMLKVFYDESPWMLLYFQPDFYGVSNRLDWKARRDERINMSAARFK